MATTKLNTNQLGGNEPVWTQSSLRQGDNTTISIKTNPYIIDEHTLACWHFDDSFADATDTTRTIDFPALNSTTGIHAFTEGKCAQLRNGHSSSANVFDFMVSKPITLSKNWTIDFWIYSSSNMASLFFGSSTQASNASYIRVGFDTINHFSCVSQIVNNGVTTSLYSIPTAGRYHIAICMDAVGILYYYVNGERKNTVDLSQSFNTLSFSLFGVNDLANVLMCIDELRISNVCRWTEDSFEVPTVPYAAAATEDYYVINTTVDSALSSASKNPVQNKVINAALATKQDTLTAGTAINISSNTINATTMVGANGTTAGTAGIVPAPAATDNTKFLKGDATWEEINVPDVALTNKPSTHTDNLVFDITNNMFTLKAGSKITIPNGTDGTTLLFDTVTTDTDLTISELATGTSYGWDTSSSYAIYYSDGALYACPESELVGGSDSTLNGLCWRIKTSATTVNTIFYYKNSTKQHENCSVPLAIVTGTKFANTTSFVPTNILDSYSSIGYHASVFFVNPGTTILIPNGYNSDDTVNNIEYTTSTVLYRNYIWSTEGNHTVLLTSSGTLQDAQADYSVVNNILYGISGAFAKAAQLAYFRLNSSKKITNWCKINNNAVMPAHHKPYVLRGTVTVDSNTQQGTATNLMLLQKKAPERDFIVFLNGQLLEWDSSGYGSGDYTFDGYSTITFYNAAEGSKYAVEVF